MKNLVRINKNSNVAISAANINSYAEYLFAPNSKINYKSTLKQFTENGFNLDSAGLIAYIEKLEQNNYKPNSIKTKIAALLAVAKFENIELNINLIKSNLAGASKKCLNVKNQTTNGAPALQFEQIKMIIDNINIDTLHGKRNKALLLVGFYGAFRRSELAGLTCNDLQRNSKGITVFLQRSKTDQQGAGMFKILPQKFNKYCPVEALNDYLTAANKTDNDYIFSSINKAGAASKNKLSTVDVNRILQKLAPNFSAHSLRSGFITTAAEAGCTISEIQQQTGHKTANMIIRYTRSTDIWNNNAANKI